MPISQNLFDNYDTYSKRYLRVIKNIFDCSNCTNVCNDNAIESNYKEHVVNNLSECPCFEDNQPKVNDANDDNEHDVTPIYEKLSPGEVCILSRDEDGIFTVAENNDGKIIFRHMASSE